MSEQTQEIQKEEVAVPAKKEITVKEVLECLRNGMDRKEIGQKYGLRPFEVAALFKHPKLKNKKVIKPKEYSFEIIDDEEDAEVKVATDPEEGDADLAQIPEAPAPLEQESTTTEVASGPWS